MPLISHKINHLLFADDLLLFGCNNEELHKLVRITIEWARHYNLEINETKTEVIALHTRSSPNIIINGKRIPASNPTYLGFTMDYKMKGKAHMQERVRKGN